MVFIYYLYNKKQRRRFRMKKLLLGCIVSAVAIPNFVFAANSSESISTSTDYKTTIPAYMEPGTVVKFNEQEKPVILREGDKKTSLTQYKLQAENSEAKNSETDLPVIKPGMTVVYDALGAPIVVMPESRESINVEMKEISPQAVVPLASNTESGIVSHFNIWEEDDTASGLKADDGAAHKTISLKTTVTVKSNENSKSSKVRILDRGPYVKGRILDMSEESFAKLHDLDKGLFKGTISW
ncbi:hypothetical protein B9C88_01270 [Brevibacillus laterosporus]|nr:hypothetical protein B9C88_01270 [Brevibacillus laterosporus]